ncbi:hypothetical protein [Dyadobacter alkalitolerans]|uniref:hypothetical protein n=1 Tax=Dyadobacter alkalitolerans TaxID=492736 RepID=UPI00047B667F|nr:hypothetical protein [Dyadobacter alkalitolerans]
MIVKCALRINLLLYNASEPTRDSVISYKFQGTPPLYLSLQDKADNDFTHINIYFNFSGTPQIELLQREIAVNADAIKLPFKFNVKQGSSPSAPDSGDPLIKITNEKSGNSEEATFYIGDPHMYLSNALALATNDPLTMEIRFYNQNPVVFKGIRFRRDTPVVRDFGYIPFQYARQDTIKAGGGFFLPTEKYTMTVSSVSLPVPVVLPVRVHDVHTLMLDKIPAGWPDGSYLLSYYEKDKLIGKGAVYLGKAQTNCLESIWKGDLNQSLNRSVEQLSLRKGDVFYAKSTPALFIHPRTEFDVNHLPRLRLKSAGKAIDLVPELATYNWGMAGVTFAIGKYTIPANLPSGSYIVTGVFPDKTESKPYWSSIEVK